jgi:hypothetical protein
VFFDDYIIGIASICDASEVPVRGVVGACHIRAELLKGSLALGTGVVGVNHAAYRGEVAGFELGDC